MISVCEKKGSDLKRLIESMAHDLTGPLSNARMMAQVLQERLPLLMEACAQGQGVFEAPLPFNQSEITLAVEDILCVTTKGLDFLQAEVQYMKHLLLAVENQEVVDMNSLISEAFAAYPFSGVYRDRFTIQLDKGCEVPGSRLILKDLLDALIEDALLTMEYQNDAYGELWIDTSPSCQLHFKLTGAGLPARAATTVFDRFFISREGQVKSGLGFAVFAINHFGGSARFETVDKDFKHFTFEFSGNIA